MADAATQDGPTIPQWRIAGDWFDVCSCNVPCPCTFAQPPTGNVCDVIFAYRITDGRFGDTDMTGLKVVIVAGFEGNVWAGEKIDAGVIFDAAASPEQREALQSIFTGQAGGWMTQFIPVVKTIKGVEFADISVEVDEALENWRVAVPDMVRASGEALTGPTADPTKRVQTFNAPGSEVGPSDAAVTWGKSVDGHWNAFGFSQNLAAGQNSKHIPFEWSGPDAA